MRDTGMDVNRRSVDQLAAAIEHHRAGRLGDAERLYRLVCAADGRNARAFHLLGVLAHQLGRADAADLLARAVTLAPTFAEAHNDRGVVLTAHGKLADASAAFERAVALKPDYVEPRISLAMALQRLGRLAEAVAQYETALSLRPGRADLHLNLAAVLQQIGRLDEALGHCERAVALRPDLAGAYNNLANVLRELGRVDEAIAHYDRALALDANFAIAHYNRGVALRRQGDIAAARASFTRAFALKPDFLEADFAACMAELPVLYGDAAEIAERRAAYGAHLDRFCAAVEHAPTPGVLAAAVGSHQPFYLAYQGENDRALAARYGALVAGIMAARFATPRLPPLPAPDEPVRLGVVSGFFRHHSNWKIPVSGWLRGIDRRRFRIFGYHTGSARDATTDLAAGLCERFVTGARPLEAWGQAIIDDAPHVLLYPEIGMDTVAAQLAAQRLARVQCASWGHPSTTGFPTIDYFLSSDLMEPPGAEGHYTETLVRLPNLSIAYDPPVVDPVALDRTMLGLRAGAVAYWCCQSLPKYLPQYDDVFPRIARGVGDCQFVFIEFAGGQAVTERFRARIDRAFAAAGLAAADHCVMLPRLDPDRFVAAIGQCDVVLDSIGWSGCNSTLESLAHDRPIVAFAGELMRGRHTAAILEMMGVRETTARTIDDYVAIAAGLGRSAEMRAAARARIAANKHRVYGDRACIAALEAFLDRAARDAAAKP